MKSSFLARRGRIVPLAVLILALGVSASMAGGISVPDPPFLYIGQTVVGRPECDTCPPRVCAGQPVLVTIRGELPNPCYKLRSFQLAPNRGLFTTVVADFVVDTCATGCGIDSYFYQASVELPPMPPGTYQFMIREQARRCPDTTVVSTDLGRIDTYTVTADCGGPPPPIPPDSLVRTFVRLATVPEHPCAGDTVALQLLTNGCPPCVDLVSFGLDPAVCPTCGGLRGVLDWTPQCVNVACRPETLSTLLGQFAQGSYRVVAAMSVRVLGTANPDSVIRFPLPLAFQVGPPGCGGPPQPGPCVVREMDSDVHGTQCALTLPPGGSGDLPLYYSSELAMAGVQGVMEVPPPFSLRDLQVASGLTGVHLSRQRAVGGWRWLVFTDPGVTLAPGAHQHLLDATISAFSPAPAGTSAFMTSTITLAAGADGEALPFCDRDTLAIAAVRLCIAGEPGTCDVNHDGRLDVRDLVRMAGCLKHDLVDTTGACVDCDSSGVFDISDIYCCAIDILRGPLVPADSVHQDANVAVSLDPVWSDGANRIVHIHVTGANALGAAMLRLDYPADRWRADFRVMPLEGTTRPVDAEWYPLMDLQDPGHLHLGAIRLGDSGASEFDVEVVMASIATPSPGDQLVVAGADLAARDGAVLTPTRALPTLSLIAPAPPEPSPGQPTTLALSAPRPNPFTTSTMFEVDLPGSAPIDLAVHDLAGRRVATLASGVYGPGQRFFHWDGAGMRGGIYYVRLKANGQVLSTRVVLLRNAH